MNKKPDHKHNNVFTDRSLYYHKYRPKYPSSLIKLLIKEGVIGYDKVIADIGCGTGIFTKLLLDIGAMVIGIEPNHAMRNIANTMLQRYKKFKSICAYAEKTTLKDSSVDCITVATAFHWFDYKRCQTEFKRILKPNGWILLTWNLPNYQGSVFLKGYKKLVDKYCIRESLPTQKMPEGSIINFFQKNTVKKYSFQNNQYLNFEGLIGRLLSTSYSLKENNEKFQKMIDEIKELYNNHQSCYSICFEYTTVAYVGKL